MIITIGEKLNSSIPSALEAFKGEVSKLEKLILMQKKSDYLDINTAMCADESFEMQRCIGLVMKNTDCGICIDSLNADIILKGLEIAVGRKIIINSVNDNNYEKIVPQIKDQENISMIIHSKETDTIQKVFDSGISSKRVFIDISLNALATDSSSGINALNKIAEIKDKYSSGVVCGLSNLSFGLPGRQKLNAIFLALAIEKGLNAAILDVTNDEIRDCIYAANLILGKDEYCMEYISYARQK